MRPKKRISSQFKIQKYNRIKKQIANQNVRPYLMSIYRDVSFGYQDKSCSFPLKFKYSDKNKFLLTKRFVIITAHNPYPLILNKSLNLVRNNLLEKFLKKFKLKYYSSFGELCQHCEDSFIVFDISLYQARFLAKKFGQISILQNRFQVGSRIVWCR